LPIILKTVYGGGRNSSSFPIPHQINALNEANEEEEAAQFKKRG
jgi:hypothetical protein